MIDLILFEILFKNGKISWKNHFFVFFQILTSQKNLVDLIVILLFSF